MYARMQRTFQKVETQQGTIILMSEGGSHCLELVTDLIICSPRILKIYQLINLVSNMLAFDDLSLFLLIGMLILLDIVVQLIYCSYLFDIMCSELSLTLIE